MPDVMCTPALHYIQVISTCGRQYDECLRTKGEGLTLELQNALDDNWQDEFDIALSDWKESDEKN